ncbi:adenylate/guanylate cyclase domain-containing protein [Aquipuribacter sp. SD81]|uniref:adenylate/guanylate cyclase domain-containing protein n=1 Tax=Aquipuribacter sp. SD81 TaxID=3127703 RepID=UPI0030199FCF
MPRSGAVLADGLRAYVPDLLLSWSPTHGDERHMRLDGTLAFVDISGFTRLTERLARRGHVGAEEMSDLLDATFSALLAAARDQAGDLVKWGGDAVLLLFTGPEHAARACRAAVDMRTTLRTVRPPVATGGTLRLRMSVGVHSGPFDFYLVGDPALHRELLVVGPAASEAARLEALADAGQVALSDDTAALLPARAHRPGPEPGSRLLRARPDDRATAVAPRPTRLEPGSLEQFLPTSLRDHLLSEQGEAEHRSVAVAFVGLTGTDDLSRDRGASAVADALDQCVRVVQRACAEHDVTFLETDIARDGGKVMLVSGAPRSSGHDEERMLLAVRAVMDGAGVLPLRIGVNRGHVFTGGFGPAFRRTYSIKGDAVNLAARVMGRAGHGEVLVTEATLERSRTRFETDPLPPFLVKGKSLPVRASRLGPALRTEGGLRAGTPFVGREAELGALRGALARAADGRGLTVDVVGEAGIGKSRLVAELLREASGVTVVRGRGGDYRSSTPYFPFRALLREALGLEPGADPEPTARRLHEVLARSAPELLPWQPLLALPLDVEVPASRESEELDPRHRRARLEETVEQLLLRAVTGPLVLLLEDAHLLDPASADLLARLVAAAPQAPWLLLLTRRDGPGPVALEPGPDVLVVEPGPLTPAESFALARAAAPTPLTRQEVVALMTRSGGNPLFLEELLATTPAKPGGVADLPESVQDLVTSQVDRLAPLDRLVLRYAAVLGVTADLDVLDRLLAAHRSDVRLAEHLPALAEFLVPYGERQVRFRHALMREVAYEGLPYRLRRLLHLHVGEALEAAAEDPEQVSVLLSLHYFHAGRFDRAWQFSRAAGELAREQYANGEAIELLGRAVEAARRSAGEVVPEEVAGVLEALGDVSHLAGRSGPALEAYRSARRRVADDPVAAARLLSKQARTAQRLGRVTQSLRLVRRALASLEGVEGPEAAATRSDLATRYALGRWSQGRYDDALGWATVGAREAEESGDKPTLALAYNTLHTAHYYAGVEEDVPYGRLALLAYEELGDLAGQGHCVNNLGVEALDAGRLAESAELFGRAREVFRRLGDEADEANATYNAGDAMLRLGRHDEAGPLLRDALAAARAVGDEELVALVLRETGQLYVRLGRAEEARAHLADARARLTGLGLTQELAALDDAEAELASSGRRQPSA